MSEENGERTKILSNMDMNKGIHKRIEEYAEKYATKVVPECISCYDEYFNDTISAFRNGAEFGYKEAIAQAIRWWKEEIFEHYDETCELIVKHITKEELFEGFEKEMLELLEEKK